MAPADEAAKREIAEIIRSVYSAALESHDAEGTDRPFHDNATLWDAFEPALYAGKERRMEFHRLDQEQLKGRGPLTMNLDEPLVDVWDDTAVALYHLEYAFAPPNAHAGRIRITDVFRRIGGRWTIMHHHEGKVPDGFPPVR